MGTYLNSPGLPFILHFPGNEPPEVAAATQDWISRGQIFTVTVRDDSSPTDNRYLLINFGAVTCVTVHDQDMFDGLPDESGVTTYTATLTADGGLTIDARSLVAYARLPQGNGRHRTQHND